LGLVKPLEAVAKKSKRKEESTDLSTYRVDLDVYPASIITPYRSESKMQKRMISPVLF
jgi:hypothetical protein